MSEPKRPRELWGLWSDAGDCWFYENFAFAFYRSQSKAQERLSKTLNPDFWRVVPVPARLDAPPAENQLAGYVRSFVQFGYGVWNDRINAWAVIEIPGQPFRLAAFTSPDNAHNYINSLDNSPARIRGDLSVRSIGKNGPDRDPSQEVVNSLVASGTVSVEGGVATVSVSFESMAKALSAAGYLVMSPEELKERTG